MYPFQPPDGRAWLTSEDDAKRFYASLGIHYLALSMDEIIALRFVAIRLADGGSDNTAYETRQQAIDHQPGDRNRYAYMVIPAGQPSVTDCDVLLWYARTCYDRGYRPDTSHEGAGLILPTRREDLQGNPERPFLLYDDKATTSNTRKRW